MEQYASGERLYLTFKIDNIRGDEFKLLKLDNTKDDDGNYIKPTYNITLNGKSVDDGDMEIVGEDKDSLRFYFKPDEKGMHILDIWQYIELKRAGSTEGEVNTDNLDPVYERRTVRFQLPVVR